MIGEASSTRGPPNLALAGITPLAIAYWRGHRLLCRLDTGADNTDFYEPFFRRFRSIVEVEGDSVARRMGGAGGVREVPVYELPNVALGVGGTVVTLPTADVLVQSIVEDEERNFLDCNLGNDVFGRFPEYIIDFRGMRFSVRG